MSAYRRIGVGLGKIAKFLTQMGAAAGRRGAIKKLQAGRDELRLVLNRGRGRVGARPYQVQEARSGVLELVDSSG